MQNNSLERSQIILSETTKVVTGAGHFDVMYFDMDSRIASDIYKPYSKYGVKAHYEALQEALKDMPEDKIPSYIIVIDRATLKPKVFVNQREVNSFGYVGTNSCRCKNTHPCIVPRYNNCDIYIGIMG